MRYLIVLFCSVLIGLSPFVKGQETLSCNPTTDEADFSITTKIQNTLDSNIHIMTGEKGCCQGNTVMIPVDVDNFNAVAYFHLKLRYNADNLQCEGFANVHLQLIDSLINWVDQVAGDINLHWYSSTSVTFSGWEKVADLVFTTKNPGQGELHWYTGATESYFKNSDGNPIPAEFQNGEVDIYEPPEIFLDQSKTVYVGQSVSIMSIAMGNQPPIDYLWIYSNGDTTIYDPHFDSVTMADAGIYTLIATDRVGCTDQKSTMLIVYNSLPGINESNVPAILIFPNPAKDILTIQFEEKQEDAGLIIYDIRGKKMVSERIQQEITVIDIGNLIPGIYLIELSNKQYRMIRKLVIY